MKLLGFDDLIARLRAIAGALPDPRTGDNSRFSMADSERRADRDVRYPVMARRCGAWSR